MRSVYNEYALKRHMDTSVHLQNFFLYFYGACFNLLGASACRVSSRRCAPPPPCAWAGRVHCAACAARPGGLPGVNAADEHPHASVCDL
jgi:hypothetical protein